MTDDRHDHNLGRDSYPFDAGVPLLRVAYFDGHLDGLVGDVGVDLRCFGTVLAAFVQFGQSVVCLIGLAGGRIGVDDELFRLGSLDVLYRDLRSARACQRERQALGLQGKYGLVE